MGELILKSDINDLKIVITTSSPGLNEGRLDLYHQENNDTVYGVAQFLQVDNNSRFFLGIHSSIKGISTSFVSDSIVFKNFTNSNFLSLEHKVPLENVNVFINIGKPLLSQATKTNLKHLVVLFFLLLLYVYQNLKIHL